MRNAIPDQPPLSEGADSSHHQPSPAASKRSRLSHRRARESLALLLDATTPPALSESLRQHVAGCARCQGDLEELRQAETWLMAQPVEAPQMIARQTATWAAIRARIGAEDGAVPVAEKVHANGHSPAVNGHASVEPDVLVPLVAASAAPASQSPHISRSSPLPQPPVPVTQLFGLFGKSGNSNPRRALLVTLAATLIVGSFAALFVARFSTNQPPGVASTPLMQMGVLDPGSVTPAFSFDPISRRLLALTGEMSYGCPLGAPCPYLGPACLGFALMNVETGAALESIRPSCTRSGKTYTGLTFTQMFDDSSAGAALLVGSDQQVTTVDHSSGDVIRTYHLAMGHMDTETQPGNIVLDQHDQLLLTPTQSSVYGEVGSLVAQDVTTGVVKYQTSLDTNDLEASLVSDVTGWLYLWERCGAATNTASCVEVYQAASGKKVTTWKPTPRQTPLAADPTENVVYVRQDDSSGQSETLALDGRSGAPVAKLPVTAQAMAINAPLHHAYLLGDDGVTVVDTRTRRKLSTLPVLARDSSWTAPAVDTATSRLYVPIQRGKLLMVQDNASGQLRLRSDGLAAVLEAERAMVVHAAQGETLYPWELPVGPGSFTVYHPLSQGNQSDCGIGWVAARTGATISSEGNGHHQVRISLAWDDHFAQGTLASTPTPQSSYPHQHTWLYDVPASGAARLSSEQGEELSSC